jgi:predicted outer membrane lipoprotein
VDDVIDVDAERIARDRLLLSLEEREAASRGLAQRGGPSARLANVVLGPEASSSLVSEVLNDKETLRLCREFTSVVLRLLGNDTMTEDALGDVATAAFSAVNALVLELSEARDTLAAEADYVADPEQARKLFEVKERETRKEMVEALKRELGPVEANAPTMRDLEAHVVALSGVKSKYRDRLETELLSRQAMEQPSTTGREFGYSLCFKRAGESQPEREGSRFETRHEVTP